HCLCQTRPRHCKENGKIARRENTRSACMVRSFSTRKPECLVLLQWLFPGYCKPSIEHRRGPHFSVLTRSAIVHRAAPRRYVRPNRKGDSKTPCQALDNESRCSQ